MARTDGAHSKHSVGVEGHNRIERERIAQCDDIFMLEAVERTGVQDTVAVRADSQHNGEAQRFEVRFARLVRDCERSMSRRAIGL